MSIQAGKILDVLILLMLANGAPLLAKQLLGDRRSHPLEGHLRFADGRRLFDGTRCDPRGACDGSRRRLLGYRYLGVSVRLVGSTARVGDLFCRFIKRRLGMARSSMALRLDQISESLSPSFAKCV